MRKEYRQMLAIWGAGITICIFTVVCQSNVDEDNLVKRADYMSDQTSIQYLVEGEDIHTEAELLVSQQMYTKSEADRMAEDAFVYVETQLKGENKDLEHVNEALQLTKGMHNYPYTFEWSSSNYALVDGDGNVREDALTDQPQIVIMTLVLSYGEWTWERDYPISLVKPAYSEKTEKLNHIADELRKIEQETITESSFTLPSILDGYKIQQKKQGNNQLIGLAFLTILAGGYPFAREKQRKNRLERQRKQELQYAYPGFVNCLVLYLGAGMNFRMAFERLKQQNHMQSALVEEIRITLAEMETGIPETEAYYRMGRRIRLPSYIKLTTLMVQNITKGAAGILVLLEQEELNAQESRREHAKRLGEEASTKLLLPMMLLLGIVLVEIMYPALISF